MTRKGFSLIEVMISIFILGLAGGIISSNFGSIKRSMTGFIDSAAFREQMMIFLLKLDEDYQQAEVTNESEDGLLDQLLFRVDLNLDGDYDDSGESIQYRWNQTKSRIERKSGKGAFQALIEGIDRFSWKREDSDPPCHRLLLRTVFSGAEKEILFCRIEP